MPTLQRCSRSGEVNISTNYACAKQGIAHCIVHTNFRHTTRRGLQKELHALALTPLVNATEGKGTGLQSISAIDSHRHEFGASAERHYSHTSLLTAQMMVLPREAQLGSWYKGGEQDHVGV
jgi:hypothetical protein